jgi:poly-gamma-glutamate synthesis protein (capsule biosynthesis protein)
MSVDLFLCGDVMTGRGIDQILPHPSEATIYEPLYRSAKSYVELAERLNGPIPAPVAYDYIWGDALSEMKARAPDLRIVNLETSVTTCDNAAPKGINYRMQPANTPCLSAAGIDCCVLGNNHVLDWGVEGLIETADVLAAAGIATAGAGRTLDAAAHPAVLETRQGPRVLVFACGSVTSGIPVSWAATETRPGVNLLADLSRDQAEALVFHIRRHRKPGDLVIASLHWGDNWGYAIPSAQRRFAHSLMDSGVVDLVHGHSSHHVKGIEVYQGRLILYGCGDFITDYEGIWGHETYRPELVLGYFVTLDGENGKLQQLEAVPFRSRRFRLDRVHGDEAGWLQGVLNREGGELGTAVELGTSGIIRLLW